MHPKLVLLPGLDGTGDLFGPLLAALAADVRPLVIRYSSPPLTRYEDCRSAVVSQLPAHEPYILLGESFSGPIAISIAATRPPGLRGVILSASFVSSPRQLFKLLRPFVRLLPIHGAPRWATSFFQLGPFATPTLLEQVAQTNARVPPAVLHARLAEIALVDVTRELASVDVPMLYMRATRDRLVPASCAEHIKRLSAAVRIVDIDAPHMLLQAAPRECADVIAGFVRQRT
jgi:pimeloyl-ACP methyl ester carboxylesterase